jgi:hypothetical protein
MLVRVRGFVAFLIGALLCAVVGVRMGISDSGASASAAHLHYLADGRVALPADYRNWPFLSAGLDMNYAPGGMAMDHHMFDNVFVDPDSLRAFRSTGTWPDGTVFVREDRAGSSKGSINKSGQFQTPALMGLELHVKDVRRFKGGWAFFAFGSEQPATLIPKTAACYACHSAHGAVDTTFVQFYPTLLATAKQHGTFHER